MQIVIDVPKSRYKLLQKQASTPLGREKLDEFVEAVLNGKPLPEGHGRLIDVNDLLDDINLEDNDYNRDVNAGEIITLENIDRIPTIIEADKAESEEKK